MKKRVFIFSLIYFTVAFVLSLIINVIALANFGGNGHGDGGSGMLVIPMFTVSFLFFIIFVIYNLLLLFLKKEHFIILVILLSIVILLNIIRLNYDEFLYLVFIPFLPFSICLLVLYLKNKKSTVNIDK